MPSYSIDLSVEQFSTSAVTSTVTGVISLLQAKHKNDITSLCSLIKKMLVTNASFSSLTSPTDIVSQPSFQVDIPSKNKRWNQAKLRYFNLYLDKAHGDGEVVLIGKEIYYRNIVLFV